MHDFRVHSAQKSLIVASCNNQEGLQTAAPGNEETKCLLRMLRLFCLQLARTFCLPHHATIDDFCASKTIFSDVRLAERRSKVESRREDGSSRKTAFRGSKARRNTNKPTRCRKIPADRRHCDNQQNPRRCGQNTPLPLSGCTHAPDSGIPPASGRASGPFSHSFRIMTTVICESSEKHPLRDHAFCAVVRQWEA